MKNFISKNAFWIIQILGCLAFMLAIYSIVGMRGAVFSRIIFAIGLFFTFFIPTTILRFLYKGFVKTDPFTLFDFLKIVFFIAVVVLLMDKLPYYLGYAMGWISNTLGINAKLETDFKPPKQEGFLKYAGLIIISIGWTLLYFLIKQLRKQYADRLSRLDLKDKIKQAQLNTLKGHLNPQFMVASLAMVKELMLTDVSKARTKLTKLSEILRYSLTKNNINSVLLEEELATVKNYVALLNIDLNEKYTILFDIKDDTLKYGIPPMMLTSLVEIATKHGILNLAQGGEVKVSSILCETDMEITVSYTGKMMRTEETNLLENTIRQRLKLLFEESATYVVQHELNETNMRVVIPLAVMENNHLAPKE